MYSGTSLTKYSGRILGAHQKIDKVSRRHLDALLNDKYFFPKASRILQFEGKNGPDAIKVKSPARDEPWHYYSPFNDDDSGIIELITDHYKNLVKELKKNNHERIAFEAAWLAHAIVDGLTPAHHYPYEQRIVELRGGGGLAERNTIKEKLIFPGENVRERVKNNWRVWGPKGLFTTHHFFEIGVAILLAPLSLEGAMPTEADLEYVRKKGIIQVFKNTAREIAVLDIFDRYYRRGWTPRLGLTVRQKLGPAIVKTVTLAWYSALIEADTAKE